MIYILVFIIGLIAGLLLSYKKHMEPYIMSEIDTPSLILAIVGWFFLLNHCNSFLIHRICYWKKAWIRPP